MTVMEKTGLFISALIIIILMCLIVFSKKGVLEYRELKKEEEIITEQIRAADETNAAVENEIKSLKTDMEYIKHLAKHEHDMAEEDELIFKDKPATKGNKP